MARWRSYSAAIELMAPNHPGTTPGGNQRVSGIHSEGHHCSTLRAAMDRCHSQEMTIHYLKGDATAPQVDGPAVIVHVCNDEGKWGRGFVLAVSRRWSEPERVYRSAFEKPPFPALGDVQFVKVSEDLTVANLIGQHGVRSVRSKGPPPIRYSAVRAGLEKVAEFAVRQSATVAMPRIGAGLAGGSWDEIEKIVEQTLGGVEVHVYDL